jgi:EAL domain-containing protein (putative c-di-GMP-specific phosphodiesterase class I)
MKGALPSLPGQSGANTMISGSLWKADGRDTGGAVDVEGNVTFESLLAFTVRNRPDGHGALAAVLRETGIEHQIFDRASVVKDRLADRTPDIVFIDVAADSTQAIDVLFVLGTASYCGIVQLIGDGTLAIDALLHTGKRLGLQMRPALMQPFARAAVVELLEAEGLRAKNLGQPTVDLYRALSNGWVEFWYQPKIDLRTRHIVGVEALARVRQPNRGVLSPGSFLTGANDKALVWLSEEALINALETSEDIARLGAKLHLAVNVSAKALLPTQLVIRDHQTKTGNWPSLVLDVAEEELAADIPHAVEVMGSLAPQGIKLAIDDYRGGRLSVAQLRKLGCAELKLSKRFVAGCDADSTKAAVCEQIVHLAHGIGSTAVAIGVERGAEVQVLRNVGCDVGQGFLFGQPMPPDRFLNLLGEKVLRNKQPHAAVAVAEASQRLAHINS